MTTEQTFKNINITIDSGLASLIAGWIRINNEYTEDEQEASALASIAEQIEQKVAVINSL